jgi:hypothetical protein
MMFYGLALLMAASGAATAQEPDATRLAAATQVVERILPPAERNALAEQMIRPMIASMSNAMFASPNLAKAMKENPRLEPAMRRMLTNETERAIVNLREGLPLLADAMALAYARRFDAGQLSEIQAFFDTPTGARYIRESMTMMSDPDVAAAQQKMMAKSMEGMQERVAALVSEIVEQEDAAQ